MSGAIAREAALVASTGQQRSVVGGYFFFQAEDGIRDYKVTGVQTCALPISKPRKRNLRDCSATSSAVSAASLAAVKSATSLRMSTKPTSSSKELAGLSGESAEIGRASCRERV